MKRKILDGVVLALLAIGTAGYFFVYKPYHDRLQREAGARSGAQAEEERQIAQAAKMPLFDEAFPPYGKIHRPPQSAWRTSEKAYYRSVLTKGHFDTLVLPVEVQGNGFGRPIRSFMTAELVMLLAGSGRASIPDPYLVARSLGDGDRRIDPEEAFDLANAIGAKRIVAVYAGVHTKFAGRTSRPVMRLTLHLYEHGDGERFDASFAPRRSGQMLLAADRVKSRHFDDIAYSAPTNVIEAYDALLPQMAAFVGVPARQSQGGEPVSRFEGTELPPSPFAIAVDPGEPARDAYFLQLLAALTPETADRQRERLSEKSLLAVLRMSPQSPDYRALKARALMNLGLRPAALAALGTPQSAEEKHLFALLNGNLPAIRANLSEVPPGVRAAIALVEESGVAEAYQQVDKKRQLLDVAALRLPGELWGYLVRRAVMDGNPWNQFENMELKQLLDREMPVPGFTMQDMMQALAALGDPARLQSAPDLSVLEHVRKLRDADAAQTCCRPLAAVAARDDILDLLEGIATDNLSRHAEFLAEILGTPAEALRYLQRFDAVYKDHPDFVIVRAKAERALSASASDAQADSLQRSAAADGSNVLVWEQGQTRTAGEALNLLLMLTRAGFPSAANPHAYNRDYPFRPFYPLDGSFGARDARAALENSLTDVSALAYLEWAIGEPQSWNEIDQILKTLEGRFQGNPDMVRALAQSAVRRGDSQAAERYYADAVSGKPAAQELYMDFGSLLFSNAAGEQARRVFMEFPGLKSGRENPVVVANYAYKAGSLFYWGGDFSRAAPFYAIASRLGTGSDSSLSSATRLALLNGDYLAALQGSLERGNRYGTPFAYGDYLGLLHAFGHSKEAWQAFAVLIQQIDDAAPIWQSALVGHRLEGANVADIAAWLEQQPVRGSANPYGPMFAATYGSMYLTHAALTDRAVSADALARVDAALAAAQKAASTGLPKNAKQVRDAKAAYVEAYAAIRDGRFDAAIALLEEVRRVYPDEAYTAFVLPAYAYAAVRSGHTEQIEKVLAGVPPVFQKGDYQLASAIVDGLAGRHDGAQTRLALALARRKPLDFWRPLTPEYAYAEACEWLFETTHDARYRDAAVDWARKNEKFQPWVSWPYAVEARWTTDKAARERAIAMAHYLDPNSERLKAIPKAEITRAVKAFANRNPFRVPAARGPKERV